LIQVLGVLWAVVGALIVVGLVWRGWLGPSRVRRRSSARPEANVPAADEPNAEWIYGDRPEGKPRARPGEIEEATQEAGAIVKAAELRAQEILTSAERVRRQVEAELAHEQARMAARSKKLSDFLAHALEEVERPSANGSTSAQDLAELEALREELQSSE
jgi:hypothetical protein